MCDPWWESETDWHRAWKDKFPIEWQDELAARFATASQARFYLKHAGQSFEPVQAAHERYYSALRHVRGTIPKALKTHRRCTTACCCRSRPKRSRRLSSDPARGVADRARDARAN